MNDFAASVREDIDRDGVSIVCIGDASPPFAYTVGLWQTCKHAELIAFGLPQHIMGNLLNAVSRLVHEGRSFAARTSLNDVGSRFGVVIQPLSGNCLEEFFGFALDFYGDPFPVAQVLWPDPHGRFPGDPAFDEGYADVQPVLEPDRSGPADRTGSNPLAR